VAPVEVIDQLVMAKQGTDLHTSNFTQMLAYEIVRTDFFDEHVRTIRNVYGERHQVMLQALERTSLKGALGHDPRGAFSMGARAGMDRHGGLLQRSRRVQGSLRAR